MNGGRFFNNNEEEEIESLYDDEEELLDVDGEQDSDIVEPQEESINQTQGYSKQNNYRRNKEQFKGSEYHQNRVTETQEKRDEAQKQREQTKDERKAAKDNYKSVKSDSESEKDEKKAAKNEYKDAKKEDKKANKEYKQAKRDNRMAKFDKLSEDFNRARNVVENPKEATEDYLKQKAKDKALRPLNNIKNKATEPVRKAAEKAKVAAKQTSDKAKEAAKETAKKAGEVAKDAAKKTGKAAAQGAKVAGEKVISGVAKILAKIPAPVLGLAAAVVLGISLFVILAVILAGAVSGDEGGDIGGRYSYNINGVVVNSVDITLMDSAGNELQSVDLEEYATGVALNMLGPDVINSNPEALKAAIVVVRSSILLNPDATSGVVKLQNSGDMVYWDYRNDLYKLDSDGQIKYSPEITAETPNAILIRSALTADQQSVLSTLSDSVGGVYLTGESLKGITLDDSTVSSIISKVNSGEIKDYTDIIASQYPDATINNGEFLGYTFSGEAGDYANWKQADPQWGSIQLGNGSGTTMASIGCYVTSYAIAIAYLDAETTIEDFNPGTFAKALKDNNAFGPGGGFDNFNAATKVVPGITKIRINTTGLSKAEKIAKVRQDAANGYAVIMQVKCPNYYANGGSCGGSTHFVVLDPIGSEAANWSTLAIWNPSGQKTWDQYGNVMPYYDRVWISK